MTDPLVVTLAVDDAAQARWDAERRELFPAGRTQVGAHVSLFHAVLGLLGSTVRDDLADLAGEAFPVRVAGVMPLGRGTAYRLESDELTRRHRELQRRWWPHLTPQDRQGFRPHVTVQNKVTPAEARTCTERLRSQFTPYDVTAVGWDLWRYAGGPWVPLARVPFRE